MKKLLITLVLPLTLTFLNADNRHWIKDQNGCKGSLDIDSGAKEIRWNGTCKGGFLSGKGIIHTLWEANDGTNAYSFCSTTMNKGKMTGSTECKYTNNGLLTKKGIVKNDNFEGQGSMSWNLSFCSEKGSKQCYKSYKGEFHKGHMTIGKITLVNGKIIKTSWVKESNGCLVWNPMPLPNEKVAWELTCKDDVASGDGVLTYEMKNLKQQYVGNLINGKRDGKGTYTWIKHNEVCDAKSLYNCFKKYVGTFKNGNFSNGVYTLLDGKTISSTVVEKKRTKTTNFKQMQIDTVKMQVITDSWRTNQSLWENLNHSSTYNPSAYYPSEY